MKLPLLPTTTVGSFPQTFEMRKARADFRKGKKLEIPLDELELKWIREIITLQEEIGIDVVVDGEPYRGDMVAYFVNVYDGFQEGGFVRSYGNRYYRKPIVLGEIKWKGPTFGTGFYWGYAQEYSVKPVKGMVTGPYTMMDWSFDEYYGSRKECALALAKVIREEVKELCRLGAKIIQIDEPAVSVKPEELNIAIEAMEVVVDGLKTDYDVYFINHICYGDFHKVYPNILSLPVDQLDLELSNSAYDLFELFKKYPFTKDIGLGVIDVHSYNVETVKEVEGRIENAFKYLEPNQIWVDPDCGGKTRSSEEWETKLRVMVEAVKNVREKYKLDGGLEI